MKIINFCYNPNMGNSHEKHILILSASTGAGHVRAAEALQKCASEKYPEIKVTHIDVLQYVTWIFRKLYAGTYVGLAKDHKSMWGYVYDKTDHSPCDVPTRSLRLFFQKINMRHWKKKCMELNPDHIICTHFLPAEMIDRAISKNIKLPNGKNIPPTSVVVTDFDVHWMWCLKYLNQFFVANKEAALRLADRNVDANKINITGIPVCPGFTKKYSQNEKKIELNLAPDKIAVLLMAGGYGIGRIDETAERLINDFPDLQIIAIAGHNKKLSESLDKLSEKYNERIVSIGYTTEVEKYMAASDIILTKTGGLTSSECLAMGKPMIVINPIPGQEERNATYLLEHSAAVMAYDDVGLDYKLKKILTTSGRLSYMQSAARDISKPLAGFDILEKVLFYHEKH
ncbi:galactosyldiacylglycerol synthase [bacterium]|nr:galactosyldiacylglycerol synthase [bacterium]